MAEALKIRGGALTAPIALLALAIAYQMNVSKLKVDLYEKRYAVFVDLYSEPGGARRRKSWSDSRPTAESTSLAHPTSGAVEPCPSPSTSDGGGAISRNVTSFDGVTTQTRYRTAGKNSEPSGTGETRSSSSRFSSESNTRATGPVAVALRIFTCLKISGVEARVCLCRRSASCWDTDSPSAWIVTALSSPSAAFKMET